MVTRPRLAAQKIKPMSLQGVRARRRQMLLEGGADPRYPLSLDSSGTIADIEITLGEGVPIGERGQKLPKHACWALANDQADSIPKAVLHGQRSSRGQLALTHLLNNRQSSEKMRSSWNLRPMNLRWTRASPHPLHSTS